MEPLSLPHIFPWLSCGAFSRWQGLELLNWLDLVSSWAALSALLAEQLGREQLGISSSRYLGYKKNAKDFSYLKYKNVGVEGWSPVSEEVKKEERFCGF